METQAVRSKLRKKLHSQVREIISNVNDFMKSESEHYKQSGEFLMSVHQCDNRTAAACKVSVGTVKTIRKEKQDIISGKGEASFRTPVKKKRKCPVTDIDNFDKCVVRRVVHEFYQTEKMLPTLAKIKAKLEKDIDFRGGIWSVREILKSLGFTWRKITNDRKVIIERSDIREKRISYLRSIRKYRDENRPIVYLDESYILSSHVAQKCWFDNSEKELCKPVSKGQRLIILHAGWEKGFIPNALVMWKAGSASGDYHSQMNGGNFLKWAEQKLVVNLPPNSVVVFDNASYHNTESEKQPVSSTRKAEMCDWLRARGVTFSDSMLKPELYELVKKYKSSERKYHFDVLLRSSGHVPLRLPPYHPDLNPIELIWANIKGYVSMRNVTFKMENVIPLCNDAFSRIGKDEWQAVCTKVKKVESDYFQREFVVDNILDRFEINIEESSSDEFSGDSENDEFDDPADACARLPT